MANPFVVASWANRKKVGRLAKNLTKTVGKGFKKSKLFIKKREEKQTQNKKIKEREAIIKSKTATRQQKSVAKAQKAALIRKRDKVTIEDVRAKQKADMTKSAKARHQAWLEKRKKKKNQKNQKNQKSGRYPTLLNIK